MAKTNASFNLSKSSKKLACGIRDPHTRRVFLDLMIDAEWTQLQQKTRKFVDPATSQKPNREVPA